MSRHVRHFCWLTGALLCLATPAAGQHVHGLILYNHTDTPVAFATVRLVSEGGDVLAAELSGPDGRFSFAVPQDGTYSLHVEHLSTFAMVDGPFALTSARNTFVTFHVVPQPIALEEIAVSVEGRSMTLNRAGFYERSRAGLGYYLDAEQIRARGPIRSGDLVKTVPGVQYIESTNAGFGGYPVMKYALRSDLWTEGNGGGSLPCFPRVYVDGYVAEPGGKGAMPSRGFDQLVPVTDIAAMEVYRSPAETPIRFGGLTSCGVILIWTHTGWSRQ